MLGTETAGFRDEPAKGRRRRRAALSGAVATLLLVVPATASATIIPQRGMLGVELGDSVRQVRAQLGAPDTDGGYRPGPVINRTFTYRRGKAIVSFHGAGRGAHVIQMVTRSRRERLANGVGVGTTKDDLIRKMPALTCPVDESHCYLGRIGEPGRRVTDFNLDRDDVVVAVEIARLPDE